MKPVVRFYILFGLMLLVLLGRLFYLQIVQGPYYQRLSSRNHIRVVATPAPRGRVFDRDSVVLADSRPVFNVSVVPAEFDSAMTKTLAELSGTDIETVERVLSEGAERPYLPAELNASMTLQEVSTLAENLHRVGGVILDVVPRRRYHRGELYCHHLGYVGRASEDYRFPGEMVGRSGLEMSLDDVLRGEPGFRNQVVDALGRVVEEYEGTEETFPVPGEDIVLTTDTRLMFLADSLLSSLALPGAIAVIDFETGDVLCLASWPTFDPSLFLGGLSFSRWEELRTDPENPMLGRAWAATYPPGSTHKVVTAAYLLERGIVDRSTRPDPCFGVYELGGERFGCWRAHGRIDIVEALSQSCDVFFYRTIQQGDMDDFAEFTSSCFGLGHGVLGLPGEREGLVPDRDLMQRLYGSGGWGLGNLLNISIGQGELLTTPLQMARVAGIIASRGKLPPLSIVRGFGHASEWEPQQLSPDTWEILEEGMREAVTGREGTLNDAMSDSPLDFYGKSGTAESPAGDHAWFIGYIRSPEPLALAVVIERGGHGGSVAAPVAERLLSLYYAENGAVAP